MSNEVKTEEKAPVQEVVIVNEKPSIGARIAEYGLFAVVVHGVGHAVSAIVDEL